jgi:hypothetical protein
VELPGGEDEKIWNQELEIWNQEKKIMNFGIITFDSRFQFPRFQISCRPATIKKYTSINPAIHLFE